MDASVPSLDTITGPRASSNTGEPSTTRVCMLFVCPRPAALSISDDGRRRLSSDDWLSSQLRLLLFGCAGYRRAKLCFRKALSARKSRKQKDRVEALHLPSICFRKIRLQLYTPQDVSHEVGSLPRHTLIISRSFVVQDFGSSEILILGIFIIMKIPKKL